MQSTAAVLTLTLALTLSACASAAQPRSLAPLPETLTKPAGYTLVWADEFDQDGLPHPGRWDYDTHRNAKGWYNDELQYYAKARPENSRIEDGHLIIEARKDETAINGRSDWGGQGYSSARLFTSGKAAWQYGYVETRAKLPCGRGLWPAIWMLPEGEHKWPDGGEIDIMEYVGFQPDTFHATVHTKDYNHIKGTEVGAKRDIANACGAFNAHSLLWTPKRMIIALNGEPYFQYENDGAGDGSWPFDKPFHLIFNIAVGGSWGGREGLDESVFPARMDVDYVRVYQNTQSASQP